PRRASAPSVLIVMGVSGSGKTTIASLLARRLEWSFEDGDWFHPPDNVAKMAAGTPLTDADRAPWLGAIANWIEETRRAGRHGVVACSALKRAYRSVLTAGGREAVRLVYLQGSRELIAARMALREGHFMPAGLLDSQFGALEEPAADELPITVSIEPRPNEVVESIVAALVRETGGPLAADPKPETPRAPET
ncbi:gluconokinase, partial [Enterovirga sp.]|uniref:gluconokinase n=1 Tax=Enterovirga sp. TaxID=2026350 RepID=UPI002634F479